MQTSIEGRASCTLMPLTQLMVHWCLSALVKAKRMPLRSRLIALPYFSRGSLCISTSAWESLIRRRWFDLCSGSSTHQLCTRDHGALDQKAHNYSLCFCAPYLTDNLACTVPVLTRMEDICKVYLIRARQIDR